MTEEVPEVFSPWTTKTIFIRVACSLYNLPFVCIYNIHYVYITLKTLNCDKNHLMCFNLLSSHNTAFKGQPALETKLQPLQLLLKLWLDVMNYTRTAMLFFTHILQTTEKIWMLTKLYVNEVKVQWKHCSNEHRRVILLGGSVILRWSSDFNNHWCIRNMCVIS